MKLLRHGPRGRERPALIDAQGQWRDLAALLSDITPQTLAPAALAALRGLDPGALPVLAEADRGPLAVPWSDMGKFVCIGLNYADHAAEAGLPMPKEPILFMKPISAAVGSHHAVVLPQASAKADWEVELGVVIGSTATLRG